MERFRRMGEAWMPRYMTKNKKIWRMYNYPMRESKETTLKKLEDLGLYLIFFIDNS